MAVNLDKKPTIVELEDNGHTFVSTIEERPAMLWTSPRSSLFWQIAPSICASLLCIPFGMMLGWPSPTYLLLLSEKSPVPITIEESPLIAAFLMFGNTFGTPFSNNSVLATKHSMLASLVILCVGWILMWQATDIPMLQASRFIVGAGNGYGTGHVKKYIKDICDENIGPLLAKGVTMYMVFGVLLSFVIGPHVEFRWLALVAVFINVAILMASIFLPNAPADCVRREKIKEARNIIKKTKPNINVDNEISRLQETIVSNDINFLRMFMTKELWPNLLKLTIVALVQQFSGAPATIVYCEFMFTNMYVPHAEYCAIAYGIVYLLTAFVGIYISSKYNKKYTLLFSCIGTVLALTANILVMYFEVNEKYWGYTSFVVMMVYLSVHTMGLGTVSFTLSEYLFPKNARTPAFHLYFMSFSMFAFVITKLFQVFYSAFLGQFYILFCFFASIAVFGCFFILVFIPSKSPVVTPDATEIKTEK